MTNKEVLRRWVLCKLHQKSSAGIGVVMYSVRVQVLQPRSSVIGFRWSHVLINNRATVVRRFPSCRTVCWTSSPRLLINNRQTGEFGAVCINISLACIHSQLRVRHKSSGLPILTYSLPSARCSFPSRRC